MEIIPEAKCLQGECSNRIIRENNLKGRGYSFEILRGRTLYRKTNLSMALFLRVKVLKERKLYRDVTRTKVKIEKVYKSFDHRKENETIWIDEPAAFMKSYI